MVTYFKLDGLKLLKMKNLLSVYVTLHVVSMSDIALRPMLAATMMSSCLQLLPAATAFAVATVIDLVQRTSSSGVAWLLCCSGECSACNRTKLSVKMR